MRRMITSALMLSLVSFSVVGLSGCAEENKATDVKKIETPEGTKKVETTVKETNTGDMKTDAPK